MAGGEIDPGKRIAFAISVDDFTQTRLKAQSQCKINVMLLTKQHVAANQSK